MDIDDFLDKESKEKSGDKDTKETAPAESGEEKTMDEAAAITGNIQEIKKLMEEKKFDIAEKRYMEAKERYSQLARKQLEQQNRIYNELVTINRDMLTGLNSLRQETEKKIGIIRELLAKVHQHMENNELDVANQVYSQLTAMFKELPDIMPDKKVQLEHEMLSLHVALSSKTNTAATAQFQNQFREMQNLLSYAFNSMKQGDINNATKIYQRVNVLYSQLPAGFLYEKAAAYQQILKLFKAIGNEHANPPVEQPATSTEAKPGKKPNPK